MTERRPHWVYDAGEEPDPRFSLANERTFLAWIRTALADARRCGRLGLAGACPSSAPLRTTIVVALVLFGGSMTALAYVRWARVERAMRERAPLPSFSLGLWVTIAIVAVAALLAVALAIGPG